MKPNDDNDIEIDLSPPLAEAVRTIVEAPLDEEAHERVRRRALDLEAPPLAARNPVAPRRRLLALAGAGLAASLLVAVALMTIGPRDAWAQVAESLRSKPWVRMTCKLPEGPIDGQEIPKSLRDNPPQIWLSTSGSIAASRFAPRACYCDFKRHESYRFEPDERTIYLESTKTHDRSIFEGFELLLRLVSDGDRKSEFPESEIEIVDRRESPVRDGDRELTEFRFRFRDPRKTPAESAVVVRVDSKSRLPVDMVSTETIPDSNRVLERTLTFDYPETGPADIYALDVPRSATLVDWRTPSGTGALYAAYSLARAQPIEPYTAMVLMSLDPSTVKDVHAAYRVRYDGQAWQVSQADLQALLDFRMSVWNKQVVRPDEADPLVWWREQIEKLPFAPIATTIEGNQTIPDRLGYYPIGNPDSPGGHFTFDEQPRSGPPGTILYAVHTKLGDNRFWINPRHGYFVERFEARVPDQAVWNVMAQVVDKVEQSPGGRWYATQVRVGYVQNSGDELTSEEGISPVSTSVYRYIVEFDKPE